MSSTTRQDYLNKRNILVVKNVNEPILTNLKKLYENDINSPRKLSTIDNLGALIEVLEKRACVSEKDITILENIAKEINVSLTPISPQIPVVPKHIIESPSTVTEKVHNEIISKLGGHWIRFARALGVQDGDIDTVYKTIYSSNPKECIKTILEFHQNNALPRDWRLELLEALSACRRNDLRKKVEYIFEHF